MLGPVLRYELTATSRRGRYYAARVAYGLLLLYTLAVSWRLREYAIGLNGRGATHHDLSLFGASMFVTFTWLQWCAVLAVVPALTAGVIADARRQKTLRDLLASGLSGGSIVLGKLAARLVHVGVFVAMGVPVVAAVGTFGGLDPWTLFYSYAGAATIALGVGGVSVLVSTLARGPREAVVAAYTLVGAWLTLPPLLAPILPHLNWPFHHLDGLNGLVQCSSPLPTLSKLHNTRAVFALGVPPGPWVAMRANDLFRAFLVMTGLQAAVGLLAVGLAVALLRPLHAGDELAWSWAALWRRRAATARDLPPRPGCDGDAPMLWKECHAAPRGGLSVLLSRPAVLVLGTLLGCYLFDAALPAFRQFWGAVVSSDARDQFHGEVRPIVTYLFVAWALAVASAAAVSVTAEHEGDTWTGLTASLLSGREVIHAKVFGALWGARRLGLAVLAVIGAGVAAGAVHPLGGALAVLVMGACGAFAAALGVLVSLHARSSTRALISTVVLLAAVSVVLVIAWAAVRPPPPAHFPWPLTLTAPTLEYVALLSYPEAAVLREGRWLPLGPAFAGVVPAAVIVPAEVLMVVVGSLVYALAAWALTAAATRAYDRVAGRARRPAPSARPSFNASGGR